ncbi:MAG: preprotein translocase subunit SecG [Rhodospirillales bacterium]|jgi:preprotein translocase subunit SecG|tara:strand:+ start:67 stop:396 length:330 start_codon:yes stop_codon:yes gene_type:complete
MQQVVLVIHLLLAISLVCAVLLQKNEGGGLGMGGGGGQGGGMGGLMTGRAASNLLTRTTAILAAGFMCTSLTMAIMAGQGRESKSILDTPLPAIEKLAVPSEPAAPVAN